MRQSGESFDLFAAVEMNDTNALGSFIQMGQEACGYPGNPGAIPLAAQRLRLDRQGRDGMTAVHLAAFHGYSDALRILLEAGADANAVCDDGETPLHTACIGGSTECAIMLLEHGGFLFWFRPFSRKSPAFCILNAIQKSKPNSECLSRLNFVKSYGLPPFSFSSFSMFVVLHFH